jgi:hypothetical protein
MSTMTKLVGACALACMVSIVGCGGEDDNGGTGNNAQPLTCTPNVQQPCPCVSAIATPVMGTQTCNATGNGFSACMGCPAHNVSSGGSSGAGGMAAGAGAGGMAGAAGTMAGSGGMAGMAGMGTGGSGGGGGGSGGSDGGTNDSDASEPAPAGEVAPGASCGVGLVTQCAPDTEKCCVRSLEPDTCIPAGQDCTCSLQNCATLEVHCDGPEDCADGQVCCGTLSQNGAGYDDFVCAASCQSSGQQRIACHEQDSKCTGGDICANSQLLTNVQVCIDPATIQQ